MRATLGTAVIWSPSGGSCLGWPKTLETFIYLVQVQPELSCIVHSQFGDITGQEMITPFSYLRSEPIIKLNNREVLTLSLHMERLRLRGGVLMGAGCCSQPVGPISRDSAKPVPCTWRSPKHRSAELPTAIPSEAPDLQHCFSASCTRWAVKPNTMAKTILRNNC